MDDFMESLYTDGIDQVTGEILDEDDVEFDDQVDETEDQGDEEDEEEPPALLYPDLATWVEDFLSMIYERPTINGRRTWCPQWWAHAEAVYRLQSLWLSWEHMRVNDGPVGAATWLVNYADPIMNVLFDPEGPFNGCTLERGHSEERPHKDGCLPCWPAPEGLFEPRQ